MFLEEAAAASLARAEKRSEKVPEEELDKTIAGLGPCDRFKDVVTRDGSCVKIIAELKRRSPTSGSINESVDVERQAFAYRNGGACAVSVITCEYRFRGKLSDLQKAEVCGLPLLRKDFITHTYQLKEARACGASSALLIATILEERKLEELIGCAAMLGMDPLVEVHNEEELKRACAAGASIVGINNRDLRTLEVDLTTTEKLFPKMPTGIVSVCESGIRDRLDVVRMESLGVDAILVGETLMRANNPEVELKMLLGTSVPEGGQ